MSGVDTAKVNRVIADLRQSATRNGHRDVADVADVADSLGDRGSALLDDVEAFLGRYVAYPSDHARVAHTL
jgi:hypothetical protein